MKRVIGIGGVFFKCRDVESTRAWYAKHLGVCLESWGAQFNLKDEVHPEAYSVLSFFKQSTDYFDPSESPFMLNLRVADLDALVAELRNEGVELIGEPLEEEFGKFAWLLDPEGNKIELWEQPSKT
ncbi:MAG: VOC family protein [Saprospiraceae bacterium]|nr:VOC family protein [Saprospiraceae bacterium]